MAIDPRTKSNAAPQIFNSNSIGNRGSSGAGGNTGGSEPSNYATELIAYAPKYKYLFIVELEWKPSYAQQMKDIQAAFVIKNSTRPNVNVEYEDINMYNFRTSVPRRVTYQPMTMRFYDDNRNQSMIFWNAYLKAVSPISNMNFPGMFDESGMGFDSLNSASAYGFSTHNYSASYGPTNTPTEKNILAQINLYHIYKQGQLRNVYRFYNPKIENLVLDDVDMSDGSNGNEVEITFKYDALNVSTGLGEGESGDINVHGKSEGNSNQSITSTADGLLGQFKNLGDSLAKAAEGIGDFFGTEVRDSQLNGSRQEAQRAAEANPSEGQIMQELF